MTVNVTAFDSDRYFQNHNNVLTVDKSPVIWVRYLYMKEIERLLRE